jgi:hypothetical protein
VTEEVMKLLVKTKVIIIMTGILFKERAGPGIAEVLVRRKTR